MSDTATAGDRADPSSIPPTPPPAVLPLAVLALAAAVLAGAAAVYSLRSLHDLIGDPGLVVTVVLTLVGIVTWLPLLPGLSAVRAARRRTGLIAGDDIVKARHVAAIGRESAATALGYALASLIVAILVAFVTANDGAISHTFLEGEFIEEAWKDVATAFWVNVRVAIGAEVLVLVVGLAIAVMRMLPGRAGRPLRWLAILYVDTFRAIPGIIVIFLVGFGLPLAKVPVLEDFPPIWLAIFALALTYGAYVAEVYRAGLESIHPSQWAAARSLGLSYSMTLRTVIIPQAVRRIVPPLLNDFIGLQKDTALIGVMGVVDAFQQARLISSSVFNLSPVIVVAIVFVLATIPQARFVDRLITRDQSRQRGGG
ncbi:MAG: amino acid ABC transporter permease [Nocardioidaceae bacterium]